MKKHGNYIILLAVLLQISVVTSLPGQKLWTEVSLNKSAVYVGEPVQVHISVYTSTWFTTGIDLGNLNIEGAFTVYFRSTSISKNTNGKTYPGVEMIYNVFPFSEKDLTFPALDITVETPPEGEYKGKSRIVKTTARKIKVKPVPNGYNKDEWLVTTALSVTDYWQGDLKNVKVGDVLVRKISRSAQGTVSELIPPIKWDSIPEVSLYKSRNNVADNKTKMSISASRSETMRYLIEKEGEITIPEIVITWYNPVQKKPFKRTLKSITINVQPNPDLGILTSIKDSLNLMQEAEIEQAEKSPFHILGMSPKKFGALLIVAILLIYIIILLVRKIYKILKNKHQLYLKSEAFYFNRFIKTARKNDKTATLNSMYRWIDEIQLKEPNVSFFVEKYGNKTLSQETHNLLIANSSKAEITISEWKRARLKYKKHNSSVKSKTLETWINPGR